MTIQFTPGADCTIQVPIFDADGAIDTTYTADAADWRISVNGGAFGALTNTPTVAPAASGFVQVVIDSTETSSAGDRVTIKFDDSTNQVFAIHLHAADARATASALATVDGIVDAILVDTGTTLDGKIDTIDANVDLVLEDTGTTIPATLATVDSNVDTLVSALAGTIAELTGSADAPSTPTIKQALALLYMDVRNNGTVTASTRTVRNDAGSTVLSATVSDDGTTFSKGKLA